MTHHVLECSFKKSLLFIKIIMSTRYTPISRILKVGYNINTAFVVTHSI